MMIFKEAKHPIHTLDYATQIPSKRGGGMALAPECDLTMHFKVLFEKFNCLWQVQFAENLPKQ